jgi:serine/threonine-protein kinase
MSSADIRDRLQDALGNAYALGHELGGGGMSRVFVADEAALGRRVVVKVLRPDLAEGLSAERFKREVRLAARLQHPHIVPLLAAGALDGGVLYYTMPFVEGESLRARLEREGALPVDEAVRIARDVASALAYAHRAGVAHRDVKPENVLLSHGGAVVADFGIAKAISASRDAPGEADGAADGGRRSSTLTAVGTSLGTPAYMAPEQAAGDAVDHRADLYALGVVAYEMLAGRTPFDGRNARQLLAAHATEAPEPITRRRPAAPAAVAALVMHLLEKNPADRPQTADEVLRTLEKVERAHVEAGGHLVLTPSAISAVAPVAAESAGHRDTAVVPRRRAPRAVAWALVGVTAAAGAGAAVVALLARPEALNGPDDGPRRPVVAAITAPAGQELRPEGGLALSPDGSRLALVAADPQGGTAIWVRALDSLAATRVEGTDGGSGPFWSPDGAALGFFAGGELRVVDLRGGPRRALCPAPRPGGGTWTRDGVIVYAPDFLSAPLFRVAAAGGRCTELAPRRPGGYVDQRRPSALPDGRTVVFSTSQANAAFAADLATGTITELRRPAVDAQVVAPHWLLFRDPVRGPDPAQLFAQRLDLQSLRTVGEPRVVLDRISGLRMFTSYAASARALIALQPPNRRWSFVWVNRQSAVVDSVPAPPDAGSFFGASSFGLSRDGRRVAFASGGPMWLHDRDRNVATRARAEARAGQGILDPAWSPGDSLIAYRTLFGGGPLGLRVYHVGTGASESLFALGRRNVRTPDWSPDGRRIAFQLSAGDTASWDEIWVYALAERRAVRAWEPAGNLASPRWSPDGRWLAYVSDETGAPEVYVRPTSGPGVAVRVSTAGGEIPRWRADGRELYYRAPDGAIMAVGVRPGAAVVLSPPRVAVAHPPFSRAVRAFDVTPDGEQFVAFGREDPSVFTLVLDWAAQLPAR